MDEPSKEPRIRLGAGGAARGDTRPARRRRAERCGTAAAFLSHEDDRISVTTIGGPRAALDALAELSVDCVVSDYEMPEMDGLDLLEAVREVYPESPFILFTEKGSEEIATTHGWTVTATGSEAGGVRCNLRGVASASVDDWSATGEQAVGTVTGDDADGRGDTGTGS